MIGVFDSGEGGENALAILRSHAPMLDIALFCDRENAPFGEKDERLLTKITERGIRRLISFGCESVLIACCTASTVYTSLSEDLRRRALPIIEPTAKEALRITRRGKIAVIATDTTAASHAFSSMLCGRCAAELAASPLVRAIEGGAADGDISPALAEYLDGICEKISDTGADVLILGCTHFVRLRGEITKRISKDAKTKIITVDSAEAGAMEMLRRTEKSGSGVTVRI